MRTLRLSNPGTILCIGAHCDDIEIGCGGTMLSFLENRPDISVSWIVLSSDAERKREAERSAERFLQGANTSRVEVMGFRNAFFSYDHRLKEYFEDLKRDLDPDLIFTHTSGDRHQDHRKVCELTWNTFRDHLILEYEIPKWDGDIGNPNLYLPLTGDICARKIRLLMEMFPSQRGRDWYDEEIFRGLMRIRGMEARTPERYAEGFHVRKIVLDPASGCPGPETAPAG